MSVTSFEHFGFIVCDPCEAALWYEKYLGFEILRSEPGKVAFVRCPNNGPILELIAEGNSKGIGKLLTDPLQVHLALKSDDYEKDIQKLVEAGAEFIKHCPVPQGKCCLIKDPFDALYLQLTQRSDSFYLS